MARYRMKADGVHYRVENNRVFHDLDTTYQGASVTLAAFSRGVNPPAPLRTTQAPRPQAPEERLRTMSEAERRQIALKALTVGVPRQPTGEDMLAVQRAQGKR
jgi:hypothetical protein